MAYFRCPKCKRVVKRDGRQMFYRGKSTSGYCESTGKLVRMTRVPKPKGKV